MVLLIYQLIALSFVLALLGMLAMNLLVLPTLDKKAQVKETPLVSILVPARNEQANIETCVRSLLAQTYPNFELLVLDDQSTDNTGAILAGIAAADKRLKVLHGGRLPRGWLGKANACRQLAEAARGDFLLFTDADTRHQPEALAAAMALMLAGQDSAGKRPFLLAPRQPWGLLSMFPRQITGTWSEKLIIPLMHFAVYALLPLPGAFLLKNPAFAAANGQFLLFSRAAYDAIDGHSTVRQQVLEDVGLSRAIKKAGFGAVLVDGGDLVSTRMYNGLDELWAGFSKNLFAFFNNSIFFLLLGMAGYAVLYVAPALFILTGLLGLVFGWRPDTLQFWGWFGVPLAQYLGAVATRLLLAWRFGFDARYAFLHPLAIVLQIAIAFNSARLTRRGGASWKGRQVGPSG